MAVSKAVWPFLQDHDRWGLMTVTIEPQTQDHASGLFDALQDERIYQFLDDGPSVSVQALHDRIGRLQAGAPADSGEAWLNWTVFEHGAIVGYTQATIYDTGTASLAFVLSPQVWGKSVAYAASNLTLVELKNRPDVSEIVADTEVENLRSQALLERLGFRRTHVTGQDVFYALVEPL